MKRIVSLLLGGLLALSLWTGCQDQAPELTEPTGSISTTDPSMAPTQTTEPQNTQAQDHEDTVGALATERLAVTSWEDPRIARSSIFGLAETEAGFYMSFLGQLHYADKRDLGTWVPVCPNPDCTHDGSNRNCSSWQAGDCLLKDGRLWFSGFGESGAPEWMPQENVSFIGSMALDGTDQKVEFLIPQPEQMAVQGGGSMSGLTAYGYWHYSDMNRTDGLDDYWFGYLDEDGYRVLVSGVTEDAGEYFIKVCRNYGLPLIQNTYEDPLADTVFRLEGDQLLPVEVGQVPLSNSYYDGQSLLYFQMDQGYFRKDLTTGATEQLAPAQLDDSLAWIIQPNCILESNDGRYFSSAGQREDLTLGLRFFDGQQWYDLELPESIKEAEADSFWTFLGLASDRIFLEFHYGSGYYGPSQLYQILLGTDEPTLELLLTRNAD